MKPIHTAEIQGMYGPVSISERLLQKIWLRGDFDRTDLKTETGETVQLIRQGTWNHQEGPDFLNAEIEIAGQRLVGSVEVHFWARDWEAHGHGDDPNFDTVVLHVVLFPPNGKPRRGDAPVLVLLPRLNKDLEEYAIEDALLQMEKRDLSELAGPLSGMSQDRRRDVLIDGARRRWMEKRRHARHRLDLLGWEVACHHSCLEVLGYRRNRPQMLSVAERYEIADFISNPVETIFASQEGRWKLGGIRPANQPKLRLRQYREICQGQPEWPEVWQGLGAAFESSDELEGWREAGQLKALRDAIGEEVFSGALSGTRLDTLICDALLPLWAEENDEDLFASWFQWTAGDIPDASLRLLRLLAVTDRKGWPISNGLQQGILQYVMDQEKGGLLPPLE